MTIIDRN